MGVLNRIVLILILLAAAGATVLSYFLFEKRTELLKGWDLMASQIEETAKNLDKDSGTNVADQVNSKEFSHRNLADMETKLQNLSKGAEQLVQQRNALAQAICNISAEVGITANKQSLLDSKTYAAHNQQLQMEMRKYKQKNDTIVRNFSTAGRELSVGTSADAISNDSGAQHNKKLNEEAKKRNQTIARLEASLASIAKTVSVSPKNTNAIPSAVQKMKEERDQARADSSRKSSEITELNKRINNLNKMNSKLTTDSKKKSAEIVVLKRKLNPTNDPNINRIEFQEKNAQYYLNLYALVKNQIKKVDTKWNFVTIDLGAKREVQQTFVGRTYKTVLDITPGKTMTIVRGLGTASPKVIGKVILRDVYADYSTADIQLNTLQDKILEGDSVIFLSDDMKLLKTDIDKLLPKKK